MDTPHLENAGSCPRLATEEQADTSKNRLALGYRLTKSRKLAVT
jgi:hypothetical protein